MTKWPLIHCLMLPVLAVFDVNLIWFGIVTIIAVEIGLLTPPFGISVFVIKSALDNQSVSLGDIFRGAAPFVLMMLLLLGLVLAFPILATAAAGFLGAFPVSVYVSKKIANVG